jgi:hypothetical protein
MLAWVVPPSSQVGVCSLRGNAYGDWKRYVSLVCWPRLDGLVGAGVVEDGGGGGMGRGILIGYVEGRVWLGEEGLELGVSKGDCC